MLLIRLLLNQIQELAKGQIYTHLMVLLKKTINFKSGTNVTLTEDTGSITFSSPSLAKASDSGTGSFVTDVAVSGHTITLSKGNFTETTLSKVDGTGGLYDRYNSIVSNN